MAVLNILKLGHPMLVKKAEPILQIDDGVRRLAEERMEQAAIDRPGDDVNLLRIDAIADQHLLRPGTRGPHQVDELSDIRQVGRRKTVAFENPPHDLGALETLGKLRRRQPDVDIGRLRSSGYVGQIFRFADVYLFNALLDPEHALQGIGKSGV